MNSYSAEQVIALLNEKAKQERQRCIDIAYTKCMGTGPTAHDLYESIAREIKKHDGLN